MYNGQPQHRLGVVVFQIATGLQRGGDARDPRLFVRLHADDVGADGLLAAGYKLAGLRVLPLTRMALSVMLAASAFFLARGLGRSFPLAVLLALAAQFALLPLRPLPNLFSFVCFAIELLLLFASRRTGNVRLLYWLPLLFVFWVNLHVEFVYGLVVLGLWVAASLAEDLCRRSGLAWFVSTPASLPVGAAAGAVQCRGRRVEPARREGAGNSADAGARTGFD